MSTLIGTVQEGNFQKDGYLEIWVNGVKKENITSDKGLMSFKVFGDVMQNGTPLGSVVEQSLEVEVVGEQRSLFENEYEIKLVAHKGVVLDDITTEWVRTPTFYLDRTTLKYDGITRKLSFKAHDSISKTKVKHDLLTDYSLDHAVENISASIGVGYDISEFGSLSLTVVTSRYTDMTYADILRDIAQIEGGFFYMSNEDKLTFKKLIRSNAPLLISKETYWNLNTAQNTMKDGVNTLYLGLSDNIEGEEIVFYNVSSPIPKSNQIAFSIQGNEIIWNDELKELAGQQIGNGLFNYRYTPFEMEYIGFPQLELGDPVSFVSTEEVYNPTTNEYEFVNVTYESYIYSLEFIYNGGTKSIIKSDAFVNKVEKRVPTNNNPLNKTQLYVDKAKQEIGLEISNVEGRVTSVQADLDGVTARVSDVEGQAGNLITRMAEIDVDISGIRLEVSQIGGSNIIPNPTGIFGIIDWTFESEHIKAYANAPYNKAYANAPYLKTQVGNSPIMVSVETDTKAKYGFRIWQAGKALSKITEVESGSDYSLHTRVKGTGVLRFKLREYTSATPTSKSSFFKETLLNTTNPTTDYSTYEKTVTLDNTTQSVVLVVESDVSLRNQQFALFTNTSFNIGQPRPYSESITDMNNRIDSTLARIALAEDTVDLFTSKVETIEGKVNTNTSKLTVQAGEISSKVSTNGVISAINQTAETIKINANKINLDGYVTISSLAGYGTTTIDGSNIKTGTISANRISLNPNAVITAINDGTLSINASRINLTGYVTVSNLTAEINNTKTYANTKANTAQSNAKTYTDAQIGAIDGVLKTYTNSQISAFSGGLGDLAFKDKIGTALLDNTIIDGGYIRTNLISFNNAVGTNVNLTGKITATEGNIGGWAIRDSWIESRNGTGGFFLGSYDSGGDNFLAARTSTGTDMFLVSKAGKVYAKDADIEGKIASKSGNIGGWAIGNGYLDHASTGRRLRFSTIDTYSIYAGTDGSNWNFIVNKNGTIQAKNADITGKITATSGTFTGTVSGSSITGGSINIGSGNFTVNSSGVVVAKSITTTGTHNGRVNATSGSFTGGGTATFSTGNFGGGYHNNGSFSYGAFGGTGNFPSGYLGSSSYGSDGSNALIRLLSANTFTTYGTSYMGGSAGSSAITLQLRGTGRSTGGWTQLSDIRHKEDFVDVHDEFNNFIYALPIGTYLMKDSEDGNRHIGINANFVDKMLPKEYTQYIIHQDEVTGYYSANYTELVPMLVKVVQSQNTRLIDLEYRIAELERKSKNETD